MFMYTCLISCKQFYEQCLKHEAGKTGSSTTCPGTQPFVSCSFVLLVCQLAHDVHRQTPRIDYWVFVYILVTSLLCWVSNRETLVCWLNQSCCESWHDAFDSNRLDIELFRVTPHLVQMKLLPTLN